MKVLKISTDKSILIPGSETHIRMLEYGTLVDELHIIVFTTRTRNNELGVRNIFIYPTNSFSRWFYIMDAYKIAKRIIQNSKFKIHNSLVTCQDPFETGLAGWLIARRNNTPLQLQIHTDFGSPYFKRESLLNRARVMLADFLLPKANGIRVVSERIRNSLKVRKSKLKAEPVVLPIFIDTERLKNAPIKTDLRKKYQQFDFIMLMASRLTKEKNIPLAFEAMKEIIKKYPHVGMVIVGEGPEKESFMFHVSHFMLQENIIFEPWTDDLASYYKTADLFLLTSNYEGYGRTVVEAQACGLPVVMTDVGIAGDVIVNGENGLIVPIGDARAIADMTVKVKEKKVTLQTQGIRQTKSEYMRAYKQTWEQYKTS